VNFVILTFLRRTTLTEKHSQAMHYWSQKELINEYTMLKMIHLTDTHLVEKGTRLYGLDPYERLKLAIKDINGSHKDADCAVITGDLTNWGTPEEYKDLAEILSHLQLPLHLLLGNHDNRGN